MGISLMVYGFGAFFNLLPGGDVSSLLLIYGFPITVRRRLIPPCAHARSAHLPPPCRLHWRLHSSCAHTQPWAIHVVFLCPSASGQRGRCCQPFALAAL